MQITNELAKEIKAEIDILSHLGKKIQTSGTHENNTEYIHGESLEASRYIVEIDRFEHPFKYYHCQELKYHCEVRKTKKSFETHCFNYQPEIKKELYKRKTNRNYGGNTHYIFENETLEESVVVYEECTKQLIELVQATRENRFVW